MLVLTRAQPDRRNLHAACVHAPRCDREPDLRGTERDGLGRANRRSRDLAGRRVDTGRDVDRDDRPAAGVHQLDHPGRILARRFGEPDAEQRVDDDVRSTKVADAFDDLDLATRLAQHAGADLSVATVVALAADDGHAAGEAPQDDFGNRRPCALHQFVERTGVRFFGPARLVGGEQRLQPHSGSNATATAAASSREWVIESSIRPAPTFSAHAAVRPLR